MANELISSNERAPRGSLIAFVLILVAGVSFLLYMVLPFVAALIMGGILALLCRGVYRAICAKGVRPSVAAAATTSLLILVVLGPLLTFSILAVKQGVALVGWLSEGVEFSLPDFVASVSRWFPVADYFNADSIQETARSVLTTAGKVASNLILSVAKSLPAAVLQLFLASLGCYFMLKDGERFIKWSFARIPLSRDIRDRLQEVFQDTAISVIWASMGAAAAQAVLMLLGFLILGVPSAFLAGGVTFIFAFIPVVGSGPVWISGALYLYFEGSLPEAAIMVALGIVTSTVDNFIRPWILKGRGEMHPLVSLVAIFGGIQMFGLVGVFLGPILTAIVLSLLQIWPLVGRRHGLEFAAAPREDPDPVVPSTPQS